MSLAGLRVVIAGASSGIGTATAVAFARDGGTSVLAARDQTGLEDIAAGCRTAGGAVSSEARWPWRWRAWRRSCRRESGRSADCHTEGFQRFACSAGGRSADGG